MVILNGVGVSDGIAKGTLCFYKDSNDLIKRYIVSDVSSELNRLELAINQTVDQLSVLKETAFSKAGNEMAMLFDVYIMYTQDSGFINKIYALIKSEHINAEYAIQQISQEYSKLFLAMDDEYMRARHVDILDVGNRIIDNLKANAEDANYKDNLLSELYVDSLNERIIIAAQDLTPSQTVSLDKNSVIGLVTEQGSKNSHTAILARNMAIPAVVALGDALDEKYDGKTIYIDGFDGKIYIEPDADTIEKLEVKRKRFDSQTEKLSALIGTKDFTLDGKKIDLFCNINSPDEVESVLENDAQGIGLFRTEFLYLNAEQMPSEQEQYVTYKKVVEAMGDKKVVIRTLDLGADKVAKFYAHNPEINPAMGMRAIRICLSRPDIFKTQLRAIYRASAYGNVAILFPMITSEWEVIDCKRLCDEVERELDGEGIAYNKNIEFGIMIETPASVMISDILAKHVDFFSIGTNDLTQYMLACDRQTENMQRFFDSHHLALIRGLKMTVESAHNAGIKVGLCGELAADEKVLTSLVEMGIDEFSVSPSMVLKARKVIINSRVEGV